MKRPLAAAGCLYFAALMAAILFGQRFAAAGALLFVGMGASSLFIKPMRKASVWAACFACAAAMASGLVYTHMVRLPQEALAGHRVLATGLVTDVNESDYCIYELTASFPEIAGSPRRVKLTIISRSNLEVLPGQRLSCYVDLEKRVTGDRFDFYNLGRNQFLNGYNPSEPQIREGGFSPEKLLVDLREWMKDNLLQRLPSETAGLSAAVILGDRSGLGNAQVNALKKGGIYHLTAVSGIHLSLLAMAVSWCLKQIKRLGNRAGTVITMGFVLFFMALTGFSMSICRAGWMMIVALSGRLFFRPSDSITSLTFAVWCMVLVSPYAIFDIGLQLSALSTFAIVWVGPQIDGYLKRFRWYNRPWGWAGEAVRGSLIISASVSLVSTPVAAWYFGYIPLLSPLTNLPMILLAPELLLGSFFTALVPEFLSPLLLPVRALLILSCRLTLGIAKLAAALPGSVWYIESIFPFFWLAAGGIGMLRLMRKKAPASAVGAMLAIMLLAASPGPTRLAEGLLGYAPGPEDVQVLTLSDGKSELVIQGDTAWIVTLPQTVSALEQLGEYLGAHGRLKLKEVVMPRGQSYASTVIQFLRQHPPQRVLLWEEDLDAASYLRGLLPDAVEIAALPSSQGVYEGGVAACHTHCLRLQLGGQVLLKSNKDCDIIEPDVDIWVDGDGTVYAKAPLIKDERLKAGQFEAVSRWLPCEDSL